MASTVTTHLLDVYPCVKTLLGKFNGREIKAMQLTKLFEPGRIGTLELKNRIVMAPMGTGPMIPMVLFKREQ